MDDDAPSERPAHKVNQHEGMAHIKEEFILHDYKPVVDSKFVAKNVTEENPTTKEGEENESEPPAKKVKLKGRNKSRPVTQKQKPKDKLCPNIMADIQCKFGESCKFSHNIEEFMIAKPADIGDICYIFEKFGKCKYGPACRFAKHHISKDFKNSVNTELFTKTKDHVVLKNVLPKDIQKLLWKKKYNFQKADAVVNSIKKMSPENLVQDHGKGNEKYRMTAEKCSDVEKNSKSQLPCASGDNDSDGATLPKSETSQTLPSVVVSSDLNQTVEHSVLTHPTESDGLDSHAENLKHEANGFKACLDKSSNAESPITQTAGCVTDQDVIKLRACEKKKIDFRDKLYLAPLTTVGNLPFRRICKEFGADITCGEMAVCTNLLQGQLSEWALVKRHSSEDIFGVQLCGAFPDTMTRCAQLLSEVIDMDFIDINCGCPIDLVFKRGEGCALMGRMSRFEQVVKSVNSVIDCPLTVKMRMGISDSKNLAHNLIPKLRDWGVSMVTIHGRSREQRYTKSANWSYINECAAAGIPMPLYGNGDILSYEDAMQHRNDTNVNGLMIARGALIKPWIFTEIKEQRHWDITANERFDLLKSFTNYGLEYWGSDQQGVDTTRRFLLELLSFSYRYIPVGLLDRLPQKINERPPYYKGRNELETLLASPNCGDWIEITKRLLGPVPDHFHFLPKHKANAYK